MHKLPTSPFSKPYLLTTDPLGHQKSSQQASSGQLVHTCLGAENMKYLPMYKATQNPQRNKSKN